MGKSLLCCFFLTHNVLLCYTMLQTFCAILCYSLLYYVADLLFPACADLIPSNYKHQLLSYYYYHHFITIIQDSLQQPPLSQLRTLLCYTHAHTRLTALFPGLPELAGTRKVKPIWILLK